MKLLILRVLVGIGGLSFFGLGLRFLSPGGKIAGKNVAGSNVTDSHIRYLGAVAIGYAFLMWQNIPSIAVRSTGFYTIICVIFAGGLIRLVTLVRRRVYDREILLAAFPELVLPPIVFLLQRSIA